MATVVAKATFVLTPGACRLAVEQEPIAVDDRYLDDDAGKSLVASHDLVPVKPLVDVVVVGSAHAPERRPVTSLVARLVLGELSKAIEVRRRRGASAFSGADPSRPTQRARCDGGDADRLQGPGGRVAVRRGRAVDAAGAPRSGLRGVERPCRRNLEPSGPAARARDRGAPRGTRRRERARTLPPATCRSRRRRAKRRRRLPRPRRRRCASRRPTSAI